VALRLVLKHSPQVAVVKGNKVLLQRGVDHAHAGNTCLAGALLAVAILVDKHATIDLAAFTIVSCGQANAGGQRLGDQLHARIDPKDDLLFPVGRLQVLGKCGHVDRDLVCPNGQIGKEISALLVRGRVRAGQQIIDLRDHAQRARRAAVPAVGQHSASRNGEQVMRGKGKGY
jgi:hypothetical protein